MTLRQQDNSRKSRLDVWRSPANWLFAEFPDEGGASILVRLEDAAESNDGLRRINATGIGLPNARTLDRWKVDFFGMSLEEQTQYKMYRWPESHEHGQIAWEASANALELLRKFRASTGRRPTIRQTKWYIRLSLSAPDAPIDVRVWWSSMLAAAELPPRAEGVFAHAEAYLRTRAWLPENEAEFKQLEAEMSGAFLIPQEISHEALVELGWRDEWVEGGLLDVPPDQSQLAPVENATKGDPDG
jgi:hypothetical protein